MIEKDFKSSELLKPILRGRDIKRYRAIWAGLWLIDTHNGYSGTPPINIKNYPAIKAHLDKFIDNLQRRQDQGVTPYNLRNCAYHRSFVQEKVIWITLDNHSRFAVDNEGMFIVDSAFMLTGKQLKYLCAFLNSTLAYWYIRKTAPTSGMGVLQWKKAYVKSLPVVRPSQSTVNTLHNLVDEAQSTILIDKIKYQHIKKRINTFIFNLYNISDEEASIIEKTTNS